MYGSSYSLLESNWNHDLSYLFVMQISPFYNSTIIISCICMIKKSDNSWFQFDSNVVCTVTHIRKTKLACYGILPDHFALRMRTENVISIIKIL